MLEYIIFGLAFAIYKYGAERPLFKFIRKVRGIEYNQALKDLEDAAKALETHHSLGWWIQWIVGTTVGILIWPIGVLVSAFGLITILFFPVGE